MNRYADNRGPQDPAMKHIAVLKYIQYGTVGNLTGLYALDGLMQMRVEHFTRGIHTLNPVARQRVPKLFAN
jgi:hypothetical protein